VASLPKSRWGLVAATALTVLVLDQLTKAWAVAALTDDVIPVVWTLRLALAHNTGAAFSMGTDTGWVRFLPLLVLVVVGAVVWRSRSELTRLGAVAVGMIVGGAVGNIIDRALRTQGGGFLTGGVVDFIDFGWWPVFNVADMGVVVGGILFAFVAMRQPVADGGDAPEAAGPVDAGAGPRPVDGG
jgi:signal peptidase II